MVWAGGGGPTGEGVGESNLFSVLGTFFEFPISFFLNVHLLGGNSNTMLVRSLGTRILQVDLRSQKNEPAVKRVYQQ